MSEQQAQVGIIGMGVMGTSLARNFARHGYRTAIWNLEPARTHEVAEKYAGEGTFVPSDTLEQFVNSLETPRRILIMVTAGKAVDSVMEHLAGFLTDGDVVVDGGNSFFEDTRRREAQWRDKGIHFMGVGVSGGEVGALEGPSIMPGGSQHAYEQMGPLLETISAHVGDEPCCAHMGSDGAGHYVKMVHNGIEYADMQLIAETYDVLRAAGRTPQEIAAVFRAWNSTELESYLVEITAEVLSFPDPRTDKPFVDVIVDKAEQKGTGRWTAQNALELGVPAQTIAEAVFARAVSSHDELREAARGLPGPDGTITASDTLVDDLRHALWASKVVCYAQGLDQIRTAAAQFGWDTDPAEVAKIWRAGCIIRAELLNQIRDEYAAGRLPSLLVAPSITKGLGEAQDSWRRVVATAVAAGIPTPAFSSALAYYDAARAERLPAALIQGLRDFFGAHTYARVDEPGKFHISWSEDRHETRMDVPAPALATK